MGLPRERRLQALGYKEILAYLRGLRTLDETIDLLKRDTRRYTKGNSLFRGTASAGSTSETGVELGYSSHQPRDGQGVGGIIAYFPSSLAGIREGPHCKSVPGGVVVGTAGTPDCVNILGGRI